MTAKCKLLLLLSLLFTAPLMADTVSLEEAQEKALQFISQKNIDTESGKHLIPLRSRDLNLAQQVMTQKDQPAYYIFNIGENGYVIVAGDDFATPILGYSNETYYDENNIPDGMKALLENYESQVSFVSSQSQKKQRWLNANWKEINPLIKTQWDQSSPYNSLCPVDPVEGIHTLTGCVPTAMAQLLYYYHWPEYGTGRVSYQWKGQTLSANLSKTLFEWDKMKLSYQYNEEDEGNAVSTLMYSCALAAGADFGIDATCASCGTETLSKYFGYKDQIKELDLDNTSIDDFEAVVYHELTNSRPVLFSSVENGEIGHLMIIDGFKDGLFHINFGWGGWGDGYFPLTAILTDWYFFNTYQSILYDIQPDYDAPAKTILYPSSSYLLSEDGTELIKWTGLESEINMNEDNEFSEVTKIKSHAFSNNTTVSRIVFPNTADTIEAKALEDCKQLESVFIPQSVSYIAPQAFYNCPFLDHFVVSELSSSYISKNGTLIDLRNNVVVASASGLTGSHIIPNGVVGISNYAFAGRDISSLEISSTVVHIEEGAFQDCNQLSIIKIPEDLCLIGKKAFENCTGLKQIVVLATTPPQVREGAFNGVDCSSVYLCVPAESLDLYLHSPGWEQFTTVIGVSQPAAMKLVVYMKDGTFESFMLSEMPIIKNTDDELIVSTSSSTQSFKMDRIQRIQYFEEADDPTPHEEDASYAVFDNGVLTFYYDKLIKTRNGEKYKLNTGDNSPGWLGAGGVSKVVFDSSFANTRPTTTYEWFKGFSSLTSFEGMEYLNTSEVINMANMYEGCNSLSTLDVSHFSTAKVTDMSRMFYGCSALTSLNVGNFNTANCTNMEEMFMNDYQLTSLDLSHFNMSKCTQTKGMMKNCYALKSLILSLTMGRLAEDACEGVGSATEPSDIVFPEGFDFGIDTSGKYFVWKSGYFWIDNNPIEPETETAYAVFKGGILTFYYDKLMNSRSGNIYELNEDDEDPEWYANHYDINKVIFDATFANALPTTTYRWFYEMYNLTVIEGMEYLNTSSVINMKDMFRSCTDIVSLDVNHFDTSNVTNMESMFKRCYSLTSLDVSHFVTSNVACLAAMFESCVSLTHLDVCNFNTSSVTDMSSMFSGCRELANLNVSHFNTSNVTNMSNLFCGLSLTTLDLSSFDTSNVTDMSSMFDGCSNLANLDLSHFDTSKVTDMSYMFASCGSLTTLDLSYFDTSNVTNMESMFSTCKNLTTLDVSHFNTSNVINLRFMFYECGALGSLDVSHFDTSKVTDMSYMFASCVGLTTLAVSHFDTSNVTYMIGMFRDCSGLTTLDVSHFDTSNATDMSIMFSYCSGLRYLDVSHFYTSNVTDMYEMFYGLKIENLDVSNFDISKCEDTRYMFRNCSKLRSLTISSTMEDLDETACDNIGRWEPCIINAPEGFNFDIDTSGDSFTWKSGTFKLGTILIEKAYAWLTGDGKTLTFCFDNKWDERDGQTYELNEEAYVKPGWCVNNFKEENSILSEVVFEPSFAKARPTNTSYWFVNMINLTEIKGLNYLNTSEVTMMYMMFDGCSNLAELDLSHFDTSKVTTMSEMFKGCKSLTSINLSSFDTSNVRTINWLCYDCSSLKSLDLSSFDFSKATGETHNLLSKCSNLINLVIPSSMENIDEAACFQVGSWNAPCTIIAPDDFNFGVNTSGESFVWKSGIFKLGTTAISRLPNFGQLPPRSLIKVFDTSGKMIKNERTGENPQALNLHDLEKGVYLVNVNGVTYKIVRK